jgi:hypothetical protein
MNLILALGFSACRHKTSSIKVRRSAAGKSTRLLSNRSPAVKPSLTNQERIATERERKDLEFLPSETRQVG